MKIDPRGHFSFPQVHFPRSKNGSISSNVFLERCFSFLQGPFLRSKIDPIFVKNEEIAIQFVVDHIQVLRNIRHRAGTRVSVFRLFGGSAAQLFGCSAVRRFGLVRWFGCSAVRVFGVWVQRVPKSRKWGLERSKIEENLGLEGSCGLLGVWWTIWLEFSAKLGSFSAKLGSKMEQNGPSWDQVGSKLRPRVAKMLPRWPAWSIFNFFWDDF